MQIFIQNVRTAWLTLIEPTKYSPEESDDKKRFSATLIIPKNSPQFKLVDAAVKELLREKLGQKSVTFLETIKSNTQKMCFIDGALKDNEELQDSYTLAAYRYMARDGRPKLVDRRGQPVDASDGLFYSGCVVNAYVDLYVSKAPNMGVRAQLQGLQFVKDAPAFSGASHLSDDAFKSLDDTGSAEDLL